MMKIEIGLGEHDSSAGFEVNFVRQRSIFYTIYLFFS